MNMTETLLPVEWEDAKFSVSYRWRDKESPHVVHDDRTVYLASEKELNRFMDEMHDFAASTDNVYHTRAYLSERVGDMILPAGCVNV
jgi:hypothetical protein